MKCGVLGQGPRVYLVLGKGRTGQSLVMVDGVNGNDQLL